MKDTSFYSHNVFLHVNSLTHLPVEMCDCHLKSGTSVHTCDTHFQSITGNTYDFGRLAPYFVPVRLLPL